jgi:hypothetical protein
VLAWVVEGYEGDLGGGAAEVEGADGGKAAAVLEMAEQVVDGTRTSMIPIPVVFR